MSKIEKRFRNPENYLRFWGFSYGLMNSHRILGCQCIFGVSCYLWQNKFIYTTIQVDVIWSNPMTLLGGWSDIIPVTITCPISHMSFWTIVMDKCAFWLTKRLNKAPDHKMMPSTVNSHHIVTQMLMSQRGQSKNVLSVDNPLPIPVRSTLVTENILDHKPKIPKKSCDHNSQSSKIKVFSGKKSWLLKNGQK